MNYTVNVQYPTLHITKQKSRLKIYNENTIFLKDKDNFELELYNPRQSSILCKIRLNGKYISDSGLILRPGQRVFLERFLDTNNKFEFSTYDVEDTSQNRSAIDLNGDVSVEFFEEQIKQNYYQPHTITFTNYNFPNYMSNTNSGLTFYPTTNTLGGNTTGGLNLYSTTNTLGNNSSIVGSSLSSGTAITSLNINNTNHRSKDKRRISINNNISTSLNTNSIETGRVEKGDNSKQELTNVTESFNPFSFHKQEYKLLPVSLKNKTSEDIRSYCPECGKKQKKENKFCPSCGTKL